VIDENQPKLSFLLAFKIPIGKFSRGTDNLIDDSFDKTERNRADRVICTAVGARRGSCQPINWKKPLGAIRLASRRRLNFSRRWEGGQDNWSSQYRGPMPIPIGIARNRAQPRGLIADGFIAVEQRTASRSRISGQTLSD